jgi:hypothetical protein
MGIAAHSVPFEIGSRVLKEAAKSTPEAPGGGKRPRQRPITLPDHAERVLTSLVRREIFRAAVFS